MGHGQTSTRIVTQNETLTRIKPCRGVLSIEAVGAAESDFLRLLQGVTVRSNILQRDKKKEFRRVEQNDKKSRLEQL